MDYAYSCNSCAFYIQRSLTVHLDLYHQDTVQQRTEIGSMPLQAHEVLNQASHLDKNKFHAEIS